MKSKKILLYILLTGPILFVICAYSWLSTLEKWQPPVKPGNVPVDAVWSGGYDGGCFVQLQSEYVDTCRFTIYFEYTGDIWYDGFFYCDQNDFERISKMDWRLLVTGYNGKYIFMKHPDDKKKEIV